MTPKLNVEVDRRGFLKCMQWAGAGVVWSFTGGVPTSRLLGAQTGETKTADFTFVQISDSHIGFNRPANVDVNGTLQVAVDQIMPPSTSQTLFFTLATSRTLRRPLNSIPWSSS